MFFSFLSPFSAPLEGTNQSAPLEGTNQSAPLEGTNQSAPLEGTNKHSHFERSREGTVKITHKQILKLLNFIAN
jgi:hypothetical protein